MGKEIKMFIKKIQKFIILVCSVAFSLSSEGRATSDVADLASKCKDILNQTKSYFIGYKHHLEDQHDRISQLENNEVENFESAHQSIDKSIRSIIGNIDLIQAKIDKINSMMAHPHTETDLLNEIEDITLHFTLNRLGQLKNRHHLKERGAQLLADSVDVIFIESTAPSEADFEVSLDEVDSPSTAEARKKSYEIHAKRAIVDFYQILTNSALEFASLLDLAALHDKHLKNIIRCSPSLWGPLSGESTDIAHPDYINDTYHEWQCFEILKNKEYLSNTRFPIPAFMKPRKTFQEARPVVDDWLDERAPSSQKKAGKKQGKGPQKKSKQHQQKQQTVVEIADTKPSATEVVETIADVMPSEDVKVASEVAVVAPTVAPTQPVVSAPLKKKAVLQKAPSPERAAAAPVIQNLNVAQALTTQINPLEEKVLSLKANLQTVYHNIMHNIQFSYMNLCSLWTALGGTVLPAPGGGSHCKLLYGNTFIGGTFRPHGADGFGPRCRGDIKDILAVLSEHLINLNNLKTT